MTTLLAVAAQISNRGGVSRLVPVVWFQGFAPLWVTTASRLVVNPIEAFFRTCRKPAKLLEVKMTFHKASEGFDETIHRTL